MKQRFLRSFPFFSNAPSGQIDEMLKAAAIKRIPKGALVYAEGDRCGGIAFLLSGTIRVYKTSETGREITLYEISEGETCILNASCLLSGEGYPANASTIEDTEVLLIPAPGFKSMMNDNSMLRDYVFGLISRRLAGVIEIVEEVAFGRMDQRLWDYIIEKSENGILEATHQKIAFDLGTSREVISRLLKDFERRGKLELGRNTVRIV